MSSAAVDSAVPMLPPPVLYPQRTIRAERWLDHLGVAAAGLMAASFRDLYRLRIGRIVAATRRREAGTAAVDDDELRARALALRSALRARNFGVDAVGRAFALAGEAAHRQLGLRPHDKQLVAAFALLRGTVAEMEDGEGKTVSVALAAAAAALAGMPTHVVTANNYLARRDADAMAPLYRSLGLDVGAVVSEMPVAERRDAYRRSVAYCANKEIAFDHLRDRLVLGETSGNLRLKIARLFGAESRTNRLLMRGLHFAIVDDADSVLIDAARTPIVISGETDPDNEERMARAALRLIEPLEEDRDYKIDEAQRLVELTELGRERLAERAEASGVPWMARAPREEWARLALTARHLFHRDSHYRVGDGRVEIVEDDSGQSGIDGAWNEGLRQLIEIEEGCAVTGRRVPLGRLTYQRFFRRYGRLAGITATAREAASELWSVYRLPVVRVRRRVPAPRPRHAETVYASAAGKWRGIAERAAALQKVGRPVLIAVRSAEAAASAGRCLEESGVGHVVVTGVDDAEDAAAISRAGAAGQATVAANLAGRGVDIAVAPDVAARGGMHVILADLQDAHRIDRGLLARAGAHGSGEAVLSLEDALLDDLDPAWRRRIAAVPGAAGRRFARGVLHRAQRRLERSHARLRGEMLRFDDRLDTLLAFSGRME